MCDSYYVIKWSYNRHPEGCIAHIYIRFVNEKHKLDKELDQLVLLA